MNIYILGLYDYKDEVDVQSIVSASTSKEATIQRVIDSIEHFKTCALNVHDVEVIEDEDKRCWTVKYKRDGSDKKREYVYRIETIELNDKEDVPEVRRPELEKRCEALTKHNDELKAQIASLARSNSAAQCYLTFWDGGKYEDLDHVLSNVHTARQILENGEKGNSLILDLFENWKKKEDEKK